MTSLAGKSVLLIIGGGIAAYKAHELVRLLKTRGARVRIILTSAAEEFVTPLSLAGLSGEKVFTALFSLTDEVEMGHIQLSRAADLVVVAPATADLMAKMANGLANDLASTALLATDKRVLMAPAMNVRMWQHPATQRNLATLKGDGIAFIGPDDGEMACGEFGPGRMAEPGEILNAIIAMLEPAAKPLAGRKVVITAGPTREPIDPVRYISNHSSGKQGYAIARAAVELGAETVLVSGPVSISIPPGVQVMPVETAQEMLTVCEGELPADIAIFTAAVADWRVADVGSEKIKKTAGRLPVLNLAENPDILATIAGHSLRPGIVVGFAAETERVTEHAAEKLKKKGCDLILANDVSEGSGVFGGDRNAVHLVSASGVESWPEMSKDEDRAEANGTADPDAVFARQGFRMIEVSIMRLANGHDLPLPAYETAGAAGMDLRSTEALTIKAGERCLVPTGLAIALPQGFEAQVRPRSGLAVKHGVTVLNAPGTIDCDYRGEVKVPLINHGKEDFVVARGDRIAQMVIAPVTRVNWTEVKSLENTVRGAGGFGSSGRS